MLTRYEITYEPTDTINYFLFPTWLVTFYNVDNAVIKFRHFPIFTGASQGAEARRAAEAWARKEHQKLEMSYDLLPG